MLKFRVVLSAAGALLLFVPFAYAQDMFEDPGLVEGESWLGDTPIPEPDDTPMGRDSDVSADSPTQVGRRSPSEPRSLTGRGAEDVAREDAALVGTSETRQRRSVEDVAGRSDVVDRQRILDLGASSLTEALRYEPGVRLDNTCSICNTTSLRLGGLPGDYTLLTIDGIPIYSSLGAAYGLLQLDTAAVSRIELLRGVNSVLYGANAVAGVVDVRTRVPRGGLAEASIEAGSFGYLRATGVGGLSSEEGSLLMVGSYTRHDGVDRDGDRVTEYTGYRRGGLTLNATYTPNVSHDLALRASFNTEVRQGGSLGGGIIETLDDEALRSLSETILTQRLEMGARYQWRISPGTRLVTTAGISRHEQDSDYEGERYLAEQWMVFADSRIVHSVSNRYELVAGVSYRGELLEENVSVEDVGFHQAGAFYRGNWRPGPNAEITHGLRLEGHNEYGAVVVPEAGFRLSPLALLELYVTAGAGFRAPTTFFEQFKGVRPQGFSLVNQTDRPERSWSVSGGLDLDLAEGYDIRLFGSWTRVQNPVTFDAVEEVEGEGVSRVEVFSSDGALAVSTGSVEFNMTPLPWLATSVSWSAFHYNDPTGALTSAAPTHQGNLEIIAQIPDWQTRLTLNAQLHAPMNMARVFGEERYEPLSSDFTNWVSEDPRPGVAFDIDDRKRDYSPWWGLVNLRVSQPIGNVIELYAGVDNLFDFHQSDVDSPLFFVDEGSSVLFDVIHIWGPMRGRFFYGGLRATL